MSSMYSDIKSLNLNNVTLRANGLCTLNWLICVIWIWRFNWVGNGFVFKYKTYLSFGLDRSFCLRWFLLVDDGNLNLIPVCKSNLLGFIVVPFLRLKILLNIFKKCVDKIWCVCYSIIVPKEKEHYISPYGGIGRHVCLRSICESVRVRLPLRALAYVFRLVIILLISKWWNVASFECLLVNLVRV